MSKCSEAYMRLEEQAHDLGFQDVGDACAHGYEIVGLELVEGSELGLINCHEVWKKRRDKYVDLLKEKAADGLFNSQKYNELLEVAKFLVEECEAKI